MTSLYIATRATRAVLASAPIIISLATLLAAGAPRAAAAQESPGVVASPAHQAAIEQGRALARALVADDTLPGLSVAVGIGGEIVWAEAFGWASTERRVPATPRTRYRIGSVSKPITAAAVGLLHQRGRLELDAPIDRYVPGFPAKPWPITIRQAAGHVAGFRHYANEAEIFNTRRCDDVRDGLATFAGDSLLFQPGTRYGYSSHGYTAVSAAVQSAAGEPFAAFVRREIFAPLQMEHTAPENAADTLPEQAQPYNRTAGGLAPAPFLDPSCTLAAGGFLSTPSDLVRFGFGVLNHQVLSPETVRMLWTAQRLESGESTGYGMGWFVRSARLAQNAPMTPMMGHGGSSIGGRASFMIFPEHRMVISVMTNVTGADGVGVITGRLAQAFTSTTAP